MEQLPLVTDLILVLLAALLGGVGAFRLGQPVIVGYLVVGIAIGPFGLRLVRDIQQLETLASIGIVLLMFALGVEFSFQQIKQVGRVATLGGVAQILATAALGLLLGLFLGWPVPQALFFGFLISLSSTMIVLKTLMDRGELDSIHGRIMIGIAVVQDLSVVPMMVVLPSLADLQPGLFPQIGIALLKAAAALAVVLALGLWLVPRAFGRIARMRSRELFLLSVLIFIFAVAYGTFFSGLSLALGAFLAGLIISESEYAYQALADVVPLRDIFGALFFISVGMLVNPSFVVDNLAVVTVIVAAILIGKSMICAAVVRVFGYTGRTALFVGMGMFQIGEFSIVLAQVGLDSDSIDNYTYTLVLAGAIITILLTPFVLGGAAALHSWLSRYPTLSRWFAGGEEIRSLSRGVTLHGHTVICGYGRTGNILATALERRNFSFMVVDLDPQVIAGLRERGIPCIYGDAGNLEVLRMAGVERARILVVAIPDPIAATQAIRHARRANPRVDIVARAYRGANRQELRGLGVDEAVEPQFEAGLEIMRHVLHRYGLSSLEIQYIMATLRLEAGDATEEAASP